jgi:hypothetical protein
MVRWVIRGPAVRRDSSSIGRSISSGDLMYNSPKQLSTASAWLLLRLATVVAVLGGLVATAAAPAVAAPPTPDFGPAIDAYATYDPQRTCDPTAKPGVLDVRNLLNQTYGTHRSGITRSCGSGTSEHYEGRALDYSLNVNTAADRAVANDILAWLLATDQYGNKHAIARRLGIMYIIWNRQIWGAYRPQWRPYSCDGTPSSCHTNHIHFSFSWAGARRQTTWWTAQN